MERIKTPKSLETMKSQSIPEILKNRRISLPKTQTLPINFTRLLTFLDQVLILEFGSIAARYSPILVGIDHIFANSLGA